MLCILNKVRELNQSKNKQSYEFVLKYILFLFDKKWEDTVMECLMHFKTVPPVYSKKILELIRFKGSPQLWRKYLEYLALNYGVSDSKYYTELAISYIEEIVLTVEQNCTFEGEIDKEAVENDATVWKLRSELMKFFESSVKYSLNMVFMALPYEYMMPEIAFIMAWDKQYTKAFEIWIKEVNSVDLCKSISSKVFKLYNDPTVFFKLFEVYYDNELEAMAIELLVEKVELIPYNKVFKVFKSGDVLTDKHFKAFKDIFKRVEKMQNETLMYQKISNYEVLSSRADVVEAQKDGFRITKENRCSYCKKTFNVPHVYYDSKSKRVYHVYCKPFAKELDERS